MTKKSEFTMKAIVFDMDGVLFDTEKLCMDSWIAVAEKYGISDMAVFFPKCIGCNVTDTKALIYDTYGKDFPYDAFRQETSAWFHSALQRDGIPVKNGVRETLDFLREKQWKMALASSSSRKSVTSHLEQSGLDKYFPTVITGDMVEHSKPEPDIYLIACRELGVNPADTYAVEDSPNGIRSAHRAGMIPLMVPDMIAADAEMERLSHRIFSDMWGVKTYLEALFP